MTDDDVRAEYVRLMGADLGPLCNDLRKEADWLQHKWDQFQELFQKGTERVRILNNTAPNFFRMIHSLLYEDAMLTLCRLTDRPKVAGRSTLTVMRLADSIFDLVLRAEVQTKAEQLHKHCDFAREYRNRRLAHLELTPAQVKPLATVTSAQVEDALTLLRGLLRTIEESYGVPLTLSARDPWGAKMLVHYLEKALQAEQARTLGSME